MLKRLVNECILEVDLLLEGRLMVKEPDEATQERKKNDLDDHQSAQMVTTRLPGSEDETLYLPGASLKGALRAQAERIARSLNRHQAGACDPFTVMSRNGRSPVDLACSERLADRQRRQAQQAGLVQAVDTARLYRQACPICQTFGYLGFGKRLRITDFYPPPEGEGQPQRFEVPHIGVDRVTGGVALGEKGKKGRTFTVAYAYCGLVQGRIILENYALWQLGLLGFLWQDLADGLIPLGHKQSGGAGVIKPRLRQMQLTEIGSQRPPDNRVRGVGALWPDAAAYGYTPDQEQWPIPGVTWQRAAGAIRWESRFTEEAALALWSALGDQAAQTFRNHRWPKRRAPGNQVAESKQGDES